MSRLKNFTNKIKTTYRRLIDTIIYSIRKLFPIVILLWAIGLAALWNAGYGEVAAASLGAGPFALYYMYEELVKCPNLTTNTGIYYRKGFGKSTNTPYKFVYPVIDVLVDVENIGRVSARKCTAQVSLDNDESYRARWDTGRPQEEIDVHPGSNHDLMVMRIIPREETMRNIASDLEDIIFLEDISKDYFNAIEALSEMDLSFEEDQGERDSQLSEFEDEQIEESESSGVEVEDIKTKLPSNSFTELSTGKGREDANPTLFDRHLQQNLHLRASPPFSPEEGAILNPDFRSISRDDTLTDPVEIGGCKLDIQVPYPIKHEEAMLAQEEKDSSRVYWYIGRHISPKPEYDIEITISSEDEHDSLLIDKIDIREALEDGFWEYDEARYQSLRGELHRSGWKNNLD